MRRTAMILTLVVLMPLLHARAVMGGGQAPPTGADAGKISPPTVTGILVFDPKKGVDPAVKPASLWLRKGNATAAKVFNIPDTFLTPLGCRADLVSTRYLGGATGIQYLDVIVPFPVVDEVFRALGITVTPSPFSTANPSNNIPVITDVSTHVCTPNTVDGHESVEVSIHFLR